MPILNFSHGSSVSTYSGLHLIPIVLHVAGRHRGQLAQLRSASPAVYIASYVDGQCYVGVSMDFRNRAGLSAHLDHYGVVRDVFIVTDAHDQLSEAMAAAGERMIWETIGDVGNYAMIGNIPRGAPLAQSYGELRAFCGRALQLMRDTGLMLTSVPEARLLSGARGNGDLMAPLASNAPDGTLHEFQGKGLLASAVETAGGDWILLRGSQISAVPVQSAGPLLRVRLESLLYSGHVRELDPRTLVTRRDLRFDTASGCSLFVSGSRGFGPSGWRPIATLLDGKRLPLLRPLP